MGKKKEPTYGGKPISQYKSYKQLGQGISRSGSFKIINGVPQPKKQKKP